MVGVKQFMVDHLEQAALGNAGVHYVGGHPMAGRESPGLESLPTCLTARA